LFRRYIGYYIFDEGTDGEFVALYANPTKVNTEEEFNIFHKTTDLAEQFLIDSDSVENMLKHLVAVSNDENRTEVYWGRRKSKSNKSRYYVCLIVNEYQWCLKDSITTPNLSSAIQSQQQSFQLYIISLD